MITKQATVQRLSLGNHCINHAYSYGSTEKLNFLAVHANYKIGKILWKGVDFVSL
jgi:hypothetical protein